MQPNGYKHIVNLGDCGDGIFRAIAAAIIDSQLSNLPPYNQKLLTQIFRCYFTFFPEQKTSELLTPIGRLRHIMQRHSYFIQHLAFVLRQIAIDQMVAAPQYYRDTVSYSSLMWLRESDTIIDDIGSVVAALASALTIPITLQTMSQRNKIHASLTYGFHADANFEHHRIIIQSCGKIHNTKVIDPSLFINTAKKRSMNHNPPMLSLEFESKDPTTECIKQQIIAADTVLLEKFNHHTAELTHMLHANILNKEILLTLYTDIISNHYSSRNNTPYSMFVYGAQDFFENVMGNISANQRPIEDVTGIYEPLLKELINVLARSMALGSLDHNIIYAYKSPPCAPSFN